MAPEESPLFSALRVSVGVATLACNFLILLAIARSPQCRNSACNCLIGLLSFIDVFLGLALIARAAYSTWNRMQEVDTFDALSCGIIQSVHVGCIASGQVVIAAMALDRLNAIRDPVLYGAWAKQKIVRFTLLIVFLTLVMTALTAASIFHGSDLDARISVCTAMAVAGPLLVYWSSMYNFSNATIVIVSYALCMALLLIRTKAKKMPSTVRKALRREAQLLSSITLVLALYIVFHVVPTTALKVAWFSSLKSSTAFAGAYGVSYGVYSVGSFCAYMWRHQAIRCGVLQTIRSNRTRATTSVTSVF